MKTHSFIRYMVLIGLIFLTLLLMNQPTTTIAEVPPQIIAAPSRNTMTFTPQTSWHWQRGGNFYDIEFPTADVGWFGGDVGKATTVEQSGIIWRANQIGGTLRDVVIDGGFAYLAQGTRVVVLDISNPAQPTVVGQSRVLHDTVGAIAIRNDRLYVGAGNALYIFSINIQSSLVTLGQTGFLAIAANVPPYGCPTYYATDLALDGNHAYLTLARGSQWSFGIGALAVIDINDPTQPSQTSLVIKNASALSVAVAGNYAYVGFVHSLRVFDISNPGELQEVGHNDTVDSAFDLAIAGNYVYAANWSGDGLRVVDISNPANPTQVHSYHTRQFAKSVAVATPYVYVTDTAGGLRILDSSNATEVGYYDLSDSPHGDHLAANVVAVAGDRAFVIVDQQSMHVVDISDRTSPHKLAAYDSPVAMPFAVKVVDNYAYVADLNRGLAVVHLGDPAGLQVVGRWEGTGSQVYGVDVKGSYAYVLENGLQVIDISDPTTPTRVGHSNEVIDYKYITVDGNYAYAISNGRGLFIFDVSVPTNPRYISNYRFNGATYGLSSATVRGTQLYIVVSGALQILDVSNPAQPTVVQEKLPGYAIDLTIAPHPRHNGDDYVYASEFTQSVGTGGLRILSTNLSEESYLPLFAPHQSRVAVTGYDAYMSKQIECGNNVIYDYYKYLHLVDVEDVTQPYDVNVIQLPGVGSGVYELTATEGRVYVSGHDSGLMVFRRAPSTSATIRSAGGELISNTDSTQYTFTPGTFVWDTTVTHTPLTPPDIPSTGDLRGIQHAYQVSATDYTGELIQPQLAYTVQITYSESEVGAVQEDTLALYNWTGTEWRKEPTSQLDASTNRITATPSHFSIWTLLGEPGNTLLYVPLLMK